MWRKLKSILGNLALFAGALGVCFAVLEFGVFKYLLVPDDVLPNVTINGVVRYQPGTRAVFREPDGSSRRITINADGWNSTKPRYEIEKRPGLLRVAVIGDSYVQGSTVNVDENFAEVIERDLNAKGVAAEVYRFGMDGAPLSQYLHVLRREVLRYGPDVVVVQLIHNDFDESTRFLGTRYASSFLKFRPNGQGGFDEVAPQDFTPGLADTARNFRTFRYLYYETGLYKRLGPAVKRLWWGGEAHARGAETVSSAVDIRNIRDLETIRSVTRHVLERMKVLSERHGFKLAFAMDGVREAVYSGKDRDDYDVAALNAIAAEQTGALDLPFLDLQDIFAAHYRRHGTRLEYAWDWHWTRTGHRLVGAAITEMLLADPRLLARP